MCCFYRFWLDLKLSYTQFLFLIRNFEPVSYFTKMGGFGGVSAIVGILVVIPNAMCRIDQEGMYLHKYLMLLVKIIYREFQKTKSIHLISGSAIHDTNVATDGRDAKLCKFSLQHKYDRCYVSFLFNDIWIFILFKCTTFFAVNVFTVVR